MKSSITFAFRRALLAALAVSVGAPASAAVGDWISGEKARVRLVVAGLEPDGRLSAGIEIELDPGWHTYWRYPGDAGIAPAIDFSASRNIGKTDIAFPAPERLDDGYSTSNVYLDHVLLPVSAAVGDPSAPIELVLKLDIGVCAEVCVPEHFEARATVPASGTDAEAATVLAEARKALPGKPVPGAFAVSSLRRSGGTDSEPVFDLALVAPAADGATLFVEGPADWYAGPPVFVGEGDGAAIFRITFDRKTATTPISGGSLRVTAVSDDHAIEQALTLD